MKMFDGNFWIFSVLIVLILGVFISQAKASDIYETDVLKMHQLVDSLARPYDFAETIKTLIYIESRNGLYPVNLNDPSCGVTHININTYMKRHKIKNTPFNRNKACADLMASPKWAILNALEELNFWKQIHCGKYKCTRKQYENVVKSYNTGWNYKSVAADDYWTKFKNARKKVRKAR